METGCDSFAHVMGNVYVCQSSGSTHVCDQNCTQRVALDGHTSVCRLSKRAFAIKRHEVAERCALECILYSCGAPDFLL